MKRHFDTIKVIRWQDGDEMTLADYWEDWMKGGFTQIPNVILRSSLGLDPYTKLVLLTLLSWLKKNEPGESILRPQVRVDAIARWTGMGERTVRRSLDKLVKQGMVDRWNRRGDVSEYQVHIGIVMGAAQEFLVEDD